MICFLPHESSHSAGMQNRENPFQRQNLAGPFVVVVAVADLDHLSRRDKRQDMNRRVSAAKRR